MAESLFCSRQFTCVIQQDVLWRPIKCILFIKGAALRMARIRIVYVLKHTIKLLTEQPDRHRATISIPPTGNRTAPLVWVDGKWLVWVVGGMAQFLTTLNGSNDLEKTDGIVMSHLCMGRLRLWWLRLQLRFRLWLYLRFQFRFWLYLRLRFRLKFQIRLWIFLIRKWEHWCLGT